MTKRLSDLRPVGGGGGVSDVVVDWIADPIINYDAEPQLSAYQGFTYNSATRTLTVDLDTAHSVNTTFEGPIQTYLISYAKFDFSKVLSDTFAFSGFVDQISNTFAGFDAVMVAMLPSATGVSGAVAAFDFLIGGIGAGSDMSYAATSTDAYTGSSFQVPSEFIGMANAMIGTSPTQNSAIIGSGVESPATKGISDTKIRFYIASNGTNGLVFTDYEQTDQSPSMLQQCGLIQSYATTGQTAADTYEFFVLTSIRKYAADPNPTGAASLRINFTAEYDNLALMPGSAAEAVPYTQANIDAVIPQSSPGSVLAMTSATILPPALPADEIIRAISASSPASFTSYTGHGVTIYPEGIYSNDGVQLKELSNRLDVPEWDATPIESAGVPPEYTSFGLSYNSATGVVTTTPTGAIYSGNDSVGPGQAAWISAIVFDTTISLNDALAKQFTVDTFVDNSSVPRYLFFGYIDSRVGTTASDIAFAVPKILFAPSPFVWVPGSIEYGLAAGIQLASGAFQTALSSITGWDTLGPPYDGISGSAESDPIYLAMANAKARVTVGSDGSRIMVVNELFDGASFYEQQASQATLLSTIGATGGSVKPFVAALMIGANGDPNPSASATDGFTINWAAETTSVTFIDSSPATLAGAAGRTQGDYDTYINDDVITGLDSATIYTAPALPDEELFEAVTPNPLGFTPYTGHGATIYEGAVYKKNGNVIYELTNFANDARLTAVEADVTTLQTDMVNGYFARQNNITTLPSTTDESPAGYAIPNGYVGGLVATIADVEADAVIGTTAAGSANGISYEFHLLGYGGTVTLNVRTHSSNPDNILDTFTCDEGQSKVVYYSVDSGFSVYEVLSSAATTISSSDLTSTLYVEPDRIYNLGGKNFATFVGQVNFTNLPVGKSCLLIFGESMPGDLVSTNSDTFIDDETDTDITSSLYNPSHSFLGDMVLATKLLDNGSPSYGGGLTYIRVKRLAKPAAAPPNVVELNTTPSVVQSENFNAVTFKRYYVDTLLNSPQAVTATLPATPSSGDIVEFQDYHPSGGFSVGNLTVDRNGSLIDGAASNVTITTDNVLVRFEYVNGTVGWRQHVL